MPATNPATAADVSRMLGDVDPLILERILSTGASVDEIDEALREAEDEGGFGEEHHAASSPRVLAVRAVLDELTEVELELEDDLFENAP
jgi:hypothetical protein